MSKLKTLYFKIFDKKRIIEFSGIRVIFKYLYENKFLNKFKDKRILEVGAKHGKDSQLLITLNPKEFFIIDLPSKRPLINEWLPYISKLCKINYLEGNILDLSEKQYLELGKFDLIWCTGVLYHNIEQFRLLKTLYDLCKINGYIVLESATIRTKKLRNLNVIEIYWSKTYRNVPSITHLPSRLAIKSWLEIIGFSNVIIRNIYSKQLRKQRAVLTAQKKSNSKPYIYNILI